MSATRYAESTVYSQAMRALVLKDRLVEAFRDGYLAPDAEVVLCQACLGAPKRMPGWELRPAIVDAQPDIDGDLVLHLWPCASDGSESGQ